MTDRQVTRRTIDDVERRARLVTRHRLTPARRTDDVLTIADDLVALHATDPVTVYLSAAARMATPALAPLDVALYDDRTLLRHHAMRRTLWVLGHDAARDAHHATTVDLLPIQLRMILKALAEAGIADPEAWLRQARTAILELLAVAGPMSGRDVGKRLPEIAAVGLDIGQGAGPPQAAHSRVLLVLGFEGRVLRARPTGTWINGQYRWAAADAWTPGGLGAPLDKRTAAGGLARRYLRAFGPVTRTDLAWWAKWTVATTKAALADVGAVEVGLAGPEPGYVLPDDVAPVADPGPSAVLLPSLDPSTMGWKQRDFHLDPSMVPAMFDRNGNGGPAVWVDGRIVGGWAQRRDGTIVTKLLEPRHVGAEHRAELDRAAATMAGLLGDARFSVRFPAPILADLLR